MALVGDFYEYWDKRFRDLTGVIVNAVQSSAGGYFKRNIRATHEYTAASE